MDPAALAALSCPLCHGPLHAEQRSLSCGLRHSFDIARQGYVNLVPGGGRLPTTGDTADMVAARAMFLAAGHFSALADAATSMLSASVSTSTPGVVVDVGAGTGWLLAALLDAMPDRAGLALDASRYASRRAATSHARSVAVVCDAWGALPLRDGSAAAVVSFFAPRNPTEFRRILAPGGVLLMITPQPDHLVELSEPLGLIRVDPRKRERLDDAFGGEWRLLRAESLRTTMSLGPDDVTSVAMMGPSAHHGAPEATSRALSRLAKPASVTAAFDLRLMTPEL